MSTGNLFVRVLPFLLMSLIGVAQGADHGRGRVSMKGSIIDTACAIDLGSQYQDIGMGPVPVGQIVRDGRGPDVPFSIYLVNCSLKRWGPDRPEWSTLQVTFDGTATGDGLFRVAGGAAGVGLQIADAGGVTAQPGVAMPARALQVGGMRLDYVLRLMRDRDALRQGEYHTTLRFKLEYF
ncbi:type 1 fimbrial protein [Enterobacter asburiae]|uniref:fimbrial protein n=1 Tax=Enterobacter asburiae TaxID=61645 RepID=UPI00192AB464|nr:fimbrial protein [Enterobacter asburiae]MBL5841188.1 type 1 fimbrial protein [Enterobacter asburiae]MBL5912398.1 type 1 fimbrial protein [Enterobacter asburiae]MBL5916907.1 type 1 fimbrial protein [Enterobacter asburiae]MBL5941556.1 type 1 fimbrial protein [Enterobacter asburiae]MBL5972024.1 type 1 fimbrial protein [Enterobacter asburiae]